MLTNTSKSESLKGILTAEHLRLNALFIEVLARLERNEPEETAEAWDMFEKGLLAHMEMEERDVIPAYRAVYPAEASNVLLEHASFRGKLIELSVAVDLHVLRAADARDFIAALRLHAERENEIMYTWAEEHRHGPPLFIPT